MSVDNPVTLFSYARIFYLPEAGYFLWFIWALWWMFVLVPLLKTKESRTLFLILCLILYCIPIELPREFCLAECKIMIVYFMFGIFVCENNHMHDRIMRFGKIQFICVLFLFSLCEYIHFSDILDGLGMRLTDKILPFLGILFIIECSKLICCYWSLNKGNILLIVSSSSYIIYLFHTTFEGFAKAVFRKLPFNSDLWYIFLPEAIIVIMAGVIFPILLHKYILNRWELTRYLFGLGK